MTSVTGRVKQINQPYGGYLKTSDMEVIPLNDGQTLFTEESIQPTIMGLVIDYGTRIKQLDELTEKNVRDVFSVALKGVSVLARVSLMNKKSHCLLTNEWIKEVTNFETNPHQAIRAISKLSGYDSIYRAGLSAFKDMSTLNLTEDTISNILVMLDRSTYLFELFGPIIDSGGDFKGDDGTFKAYKGSHIQSGDYDFLSKDTLWDFNVSVRPPDKNKLLQLVVYYVMALESDAARFKNIQYIGIFNPRLNTVWRISIKELGPNFLALVRKDIIGYTI